MVADRLKIKLCGTAAAVGKDAGVDAADVFV
jgi:hypothetical protein